MTTKELIKTLEYLDPQGTKEVFVKDNNCLFPLYPSSLSKEKDPDEEKEFIIKIRI